jgi:hypothetical protein
VCTSVVACGDAPPVFELGEHVLDLMALTIEDFIIVEWLLAAFGWGDAWQGALLGQSLAEPVAVVTAVAEQCSGLWQARQ